MPDAPLDHFDELDETNPYAPPKTAIGQVVGKNEFWCEGNLLVMRIGAILPDRCVMCNAPARGVQWHTRISWHPPWIYLLLLAFVLPYAIVALFFTRFAEISVGVCRHHLVRRRMILAALFLSHSAGILMIIFGVSMLNNFGAGGVSLILCGGLTIIVGVVAGAIFAPLVVTSEITTTLVRLKGVHPEYLAMLESVETARAGA
ncbi:MAG: hypothetical protein KGM43_07980 [Planctomycetota bacterium]|nr:hypothetical protein [Planctomycetota bacterium]